MTKAVSVLKACAIILNALLAVFLTLVIIQVQFSGSQLIMLTAVVFCSILNIILLALSKRLLTGATGVFFLYLSTVLNLSSLLGVIAGLTQWGMPKDDLITAIAIIIWFAFPIITPPAIFLTRRQLIKNNASNPKTITCPNCGTEISKY